MIQENNYDEATAKLDSLKTYITESETQVETISNNSATEFKASAQSFLGFIKSDVIPTYAEAITFYKMAADRENKGINKANQLITNINVKIKEKRDELMNTQSDFAEKNNMKLSSN